ncbi:MAG: GNAT family N-acetyltransferase [Pseudomonadota bacterium]
MSAAPDADGSAASLWPRDWFWLDQLEESWPPAHREERAGLVLRADAPAAGSRVNAARLLGAQSAAPEIDAPSAVAAINAFYASRGAAALYQSSYPLRVAEAAAAPPNPDAPAAAAAVFTAQDPLERALAAAGFALFDPCLLMVAAHSAVREAALRRRSGDPRLRACAISAPLSALNAIWDAGEVGPERRAVMRRAAAGEIIAFRAGNGLGGALFLGVARGSGAASGHATGFIHALHSDPAARRLGGAAQAVGLAATMAEEAGAARLAALIRIGNIPARGFFAAMGFHCAGAYAYWRRPL